MLQATNDFLLHFLYFFTFTKRYDAFFFLGYFLVLGMKWIKITWNLYCITALGTLDIAVWQGCVKYIYTNYEVKQQRNTMKIHLLRSTKKKNPFPYENHNLFHIYLRKYSQNDWILNTVVRFMCTILSPFSLSHLHRCSKLNIVSYFSSVFL